MLLQPDERDDNAVSSHLVCLRRNEGSSNCQSTPPPPRDLYLHIPHTPYIQHAHTLEDATLAPCRYQRDALRR
jgi:hypothetical protein